MVSLRVGDTPQPLGTFIYLLPRTQLVLQGGVVMLSGP